MKSLTFLVIINTLISYNDAQNITHPRGSYTTWIKGSSSMNQNGVYGSQGIESPNNTPGARTSAIIWTDSVGNAYLFGGLGFGGSSSSGYLNDVWCLSISSLSWKWLKGSSDINQIGIYGSIGIESMNNTPGGRSEPASWTDSYGNAYLFGGLGFGSSSPGSLNDVWFLNISSLSWKWLKGSSDINQLGIYGSIGIESVSTIPGGREGAASWNTEILIYLEVEDMDHQHHQLDLLMIFGI
jgi:hypothetical protein